MNKDQIRGKIRELVVEYYKEAFKPADFIPGETLVNYAGRMFDEKELTNLVDSSLDFWLTSGRFSQDFEMALSDYLDVSDVILTNSGSSANLVAMSTLTSEKLGDKALKPGDEVITVAAGFPATVAPIIQNGLIPVFVDVEIGTYNVIIDEVRKALSDKTRAIFIAHTLGNPIDLGAITKIVEENDLWLIEDNCDALGSTYDGQLTGTFGHLATLSFYPAHHITTGEGGAVVTNDELLAKIARSFRDWGRDCYCAGGENDTCGKRFTQKYGELPLGYDHKYVYSHIGYNLKMTDMQAAIGASQMDKIDSFTAKRKSNFKFLYEGLKQFEDKLILPRATENSDPSWFVFILSVKDDAVFTRDDLTKYLNGCRIETRNLFCGNILRQPAYLNIKHRTVSDLENTDFAMNNTFFIGLYPGMTEEKMIYIIESFKKFFEEK